MPNIETQGLLEDYRVATGKYDAIARGNLNKDEILKFLEYVAPLSAPRGDDDCPPSINAIITGDTYSCFYGDSGVIRCTDSQEESMTPKIAVQIICKELSIADYDLSKGHTNLKRAPWLTIGLVVLAIFSIVYSLMT